MDIYFRDNLEDYRIENVFYLEITFCCFLHIFEIFHPMVFFWNFAVEDFTIEFLYDFDHFFLNT
jgi:hypothetical protein